jgi:thiamine biosynthesis lipoprotein
MGTEAEVILVGGSPALLDRARARLEELEARWSRFRPTSEICRLNRSGGQVTIVSPETFDLVAEGVTAWYATAGGFDPTVLDAVEAAGYDRTFADVVPDSDEPSRLRPAPGCRDIVLYPSVRAVRMPPGVRFDPGGIGKGQAADLVTGELLAAGAAGVCVNMGGDVRVAGAAPTERGWTIGIVDPHHPDLDLCQVALADGAAVTSTRLVRQWRRAGVPRHHLIHPRTGLSAWTGVSAVTVVAAGAARAEVLAKAAFITGIEEGGRLLEAAGVSGLLIDDAGALHFAGQLKGMLV